MLAFRKFTFHVLPACPPSIVRTLDKLGLFVSVLPSVPLHLARRPAAAPSHPVHAHHDVLLHWPVPGVRPQAPPHRRAGGFHPGRPGGLLHSEWTTLPSHSRRADDSKSKLLLMFVTQGFCFLFLSPFFFFPGFLRVRLVQDQRETFESLPNPGEERPRSPCRHQGAQQPSHHGVVAAVTRSSAIQIATAAAGPNWILAKLWASSWIRTNCGGSVTGEESTENKSGNIFAFLTERKNPRFFPHSLSHEGSNVEKWKGALLFLFLRRSAAPLLRQGRSTSKSGNQTQRPAWWGSGAFLPFPHHFL